MLELAVFHEASFMANGKEGLAVGVAVGQIKQCAVVVKDIEEIPHE